MKDIIAILKIAVGALMGWFFSSMALSAVWNWLIAPFHEAVPILPFRVCLGLMLIYIWLFPNKLSSPGVIEKEKEGYDWSDYYCKAVAYPAVVLGLAYLVKTLIAA